MTTLVHRSPTKTLPIVPLKRKSLDSSEVSSDSSSDEPPHRLSRSHRQRLSHAHPSTPSPPLSIKDSQSQISVVIPSPTTYQRRQFALAHSIESTSINGMSDEAFPTNEEDERISRAAYPSVSGQDNFDRAVLPLSFKSAPGSMQGFESLDPERHLVLLRQTLQAKLDSIKGPPVTPFVSCPKLLAKLADNFVFINEYQYRASVNPISDEWNVGCGCVGGCDRTRCDCLSQEVDSEELIVPYQICQDNDKLYVATQEFLHRRAMIHECTSRCSCHGIQCWNHVVQNGRTVSFEIFDTGPRGFGMSFSFKLSGPH